MFNRRRGVNSSENRINTSLNKYESLSDRLPLLSVLFFSPPLQRNRGKPWINSGSKSDTFESVAIF